MKRRLSLLLAILMLISVICVAPVSASATDALSTVYFDNSVAQWNAVYVYGWNYGLSTHAMTRIEGTDIWSLELPQAIPNGEKCFLFKNTANNWDKQSNDVTITSPYNCYKMEGNHKSASVWGTYADGVTQYPEAYKLTRVYADNSEAGWEQVYIYGWNESGLDGAAALMTQIEGTDIWYYDFATPLASGAECFLFKATEDWTMQNANAVVTEPYNCYILSPDHQGAGTWTTYTEAPETTAAPETTQAPAETDPVETTTEAPAETDPVETTQAPVEEPDDSGYYLVGNLNGEDFWNNVPFTADRKLAANPAVEGEYYLDWTFYTNDEIKVVYYDGTEITRWYGDGDNYRIGEDKAGDCTVYFRPDGNDYWSYFYLNVIKKEVPTEDPTEAPTETPDTPTTGDEIPTDPTESTEPDVSVPAEDCITVYFQNNWLWTDVRAYYWGSASGECKEYPGIKMDFYANDGNYDVYSCKIPADATGIKISGIKDDGTGDRDATPDITDFADGRCFYMTWDNGNAVGYVDISVIIPVVETISAEIKGYSLTLSGNIGVNFFYDLSEALLAVDGAKVVFTYADKTYEVAVTDGVYDEETGFYKFTCEVPAKDMATVINCKVVAGEYESETATQSVKGYAEVILSDTVKYANEQKLVKAMLNYGSAAQTYFGYNTDNLANDTECMTDADRYIAPMTFGESALTVEQLNDGIIYYGTALSLKSETAVKHYFIIDEEVVDVDSLDILCPQGYDVEFKKNGNLYEIKICDIPANKLGDNLHIYLDDYVRVVYMPSYSYGYAAQNSGNVELCNVAIALYDYYIQADRYNY